MGAWGSNLYQDDIAAEKGIIIKTNYTGKRRDMKSHGIGSTK